MSDSSQAPVNPWVALIVTVLTSSLISGWALPILWSTLYVSPDFAVVVEPDLSSAVIRNTGHAAAHNTKITIRISGNQTDALAFSSENATFDRSYHEQEDVTLVVFQLKRMARQSLVQVNFKHYSGEILEIWVQSDEEGAYVIATRGKGAGQPVDYPSQIIEWFKGNLTSVQYYITLFALIFISWRFLKVRYPRIWPWSHLVNSRFPLSVKWTLG